MINAALLGIAGQVMGIVDLLETCFRSAVPDNFFVRNHTCRHNPVRITDFGLIRIKILSTCQFFYQGSWMLNPVYKKVCVTYTDLSTFVVGRTTVKNQVSPWLLYKICL